MGVTFDVSDVELGGPLELEPKPVPEAIHLLTSSGHTTAEMGEDNRIVVHEHRPPLPPFEASSEGPVHTLGMHPFVAAVQLAFDRHLPLVWSPDQVWIVLAQGFAQHVRLHAEELREGIVRHDGREIIRVRRDDFVKGNPDNPWPEVFDAFADALRDRIGKRHDLVVADFTTTGPLERAVSQLVLMDAMEKYFDYRLRSLCGIPSVTLEGTPDDWRSIRTRVRAFGELGLAPWVAALLPILDELVASAEGRPDAAFWRSVYKRNSSSGGPYITGWLQVLFPYLVNVHARTTFPNENLATWREGMEAPFGGGPTTDQLPGGISRVPFTWEILGGEVPMELLGGFVGVTQDPSSRAVTARLGWAVRDRV